MQASKRRLHLGLNAHRSLNTERRPLGPSATRSRPGMTVGHWLPPRPKDRTKCRAVGQASPARRPRQTREPTPEQRRNTKNMLRHRAPTTGCGTSTPRASARPSAALSSPRTPSISPAPAWCRGMAAPRAAASGSARAPAGRPRSTPCPRCSPSSAAPPVGSSGTTWRWRNQNGAPPEAIAGDGEFLGTRAGDFDRCERPSAGEKLRG
jgi:hypothetical protein